MPQTDLVRGGLTHGLAVVDGHGVEALIAGDSVHDDGRRASQCQQVKRCAAIVGRYEDQAIDIAPQ